jgi:3-dehydroquinate dehydratase/shikimate dehydrogenase
MPPDLPQIAARLAQAGADVVKVVGMGHQVQDNLPVLQTLRAADRPTIAICMGEAGIVSRLAALTFPQAFLTYATLGEGRQVAPGQLPVAVMREHYLADEVTYQTALVGLVHRGPADHALAGEYNRGLRSAGADGLCVPFPLGDGDPLAVVRAFAAEGWVGFALKEPLADLAALDVVEASARTAGKVDVVVCRLGQLWGLWAGSRERQVRLLAEACLPT